MDRSEGLSLLKEKVGSDNLVKHCLATEAIMRVLARRFGEDEDKWALAGLLHDLDFEETKDAPHTHGLRTAAMLKDLGVDDEIISTIKAHNAERLGGPSGSQGRPGPQPQGHPEPSRGGQRQTRFEHALAAAETITGLIVATALVYPDKKLAGVRPDSIVKRMKKKDFARNIDRNVIMECERIGLDLNEFVKICLEAMQKISEELGL